MQLHSGALRNFNLHGGRKAQWAEQTCSRGKIANFVFSHQDPINTRQIETGFSAHALIFIDVRF
jgi:hypothetical protein